MIPATAILVTRGDVSVRPILEHWGNLFYETIVWVNGAGVTRSDPWGVRVETIVKGRADDPFPDLSVYGRYAAIEHATQDLIYVQDDDCFCHGIPDLYGAHEPDRITANMPESRWDDYPDSCLVGWGAFFEKDLPAKAFARCGFDGRTSPFIEDDWEYYKLNHLGVQWPSADLFRRDCDVAFTTLTPHEKLDVGFSHLPWAEQPDRLFKQAEHAPLRAEMLHEARKVRDRT